MKNNKVSAQFIKFVFLFTLVLTTFAIGAFAQTDPGSDPDVPIDGGLSVLLAAGVGYGIKELRKKKAEKNIK
jgi:hypothetical protein